MQIVAKIETSVHLFGALGRKVPPVLEPILWSLAGTAPVFSSSASLISSYASILAIGMLMAALGIRVFLGHGGPRITALGIFAISSSIVVGLGAVQEVISPHNRTHAIFLECAVYFSFVAQVLVCFIAWRIRLPIAGRGPIIDLGSARILLVASVTTLGALSILALSEQSRNQLLEPSAFTTIVLIAVAVLSRPSRASLIRQAAILIFSLALYAQLFQGGSGRLRLVALACTIAVIWSTTHPQKYFKLVLLCMTPLAIAFLASQRLSLQESIRAGASAGRTGLESMTEPILVFAQIIQAQVDLGQPLAGGQTLLTLPISLFPGTNTLGGLGEPLGYQLVRITDPTRYGTGYSVAATTFGEWWFNFSAAAILFVVPFLVLLLHFLDRKQSRFIAQGLSGPASLFWYVVVTMACGSVADLAWMGLHIYGARMLWRLPLLALTTICLFPLLRGARRSKLEFQHHDAIRHGLQTVPESVRAHRKSRLPGKPA